MNINTHNKKNTSFHNMEPHTGFYLWSVRSPGLRLRLIRGYQYFALTEQIILLKTCLPLFRVRTNQPSAGYQEIFRYVENLFSPNLPVSVNSEFVLNAQTALHFKKRILFFLCTSLCSLR